MVVYFRIYNQYSKTMKFGVALITGLIITQGSCGGAIIQNKYGNYGPVSNNKETVNDYQKQSTNTVDLGHKDQGKSKSNDKSKGKGKSNDKSKGKNNDKSKGKNNDKS